MPRAGRFSRVLKQFRWWSLLAAVLVAIFVWRWFDGHLADSPGALPGNLTIDRSFPGPLTGLVINLGDFGCSDEPRGPRTCSLDLVYENIGGLVAPETGDCLIDPARFLVLVDQQGRHHDPNPGNCPGSDPAWPSETGQMLSTTVGFDLPAEVAPARLLVAGQLIDLKDPGQTLPAQAVGEIFASQDGAVDYQVAEFDCRVLADVSRDEAYRWWRRLTNEFNNDRYNHDRNLTTGKVAKHWQVCRLVVDYENTGPDDLFWEDSCRASVYRNVRLVDSRGWQHKALDDRICQPEEVVWPPGSRASETVEFVIDRQLGVERLVVLDQLFDGNP